MVNKNYSTMVFSKIAYLNNLKTLMLVFVIMIHSAVIYSGKGFFFYIETRHLDKYSNYFFEFFQAFTQAYFMSLLFTIFGYFLPDLLAKKGTKKFISDRFYHLGLPSLIYALLLYPIGEKIADPTFDWNHYIDGILSFKFISWTGPMWFTLTLLIFTLIYLAFKKWFDILITKCSFQFRVRNVLSLILLIALVAFLLRLVFPIGTMIINFQFDYFSSYFFMFFFGIFAREKNIFQTLDYQKAKKWFVAAFAIGVPLFIGIVFSTHMQDPRSLLSGWHLLALVNALWESFFCVAISIGLVGIFKKHFSTQNQFQKFLSDNFLAVYFFYVPILISIAVLLKNVELPPILKFVMVVLIALPTCFIFAYFIRKIPFLKKLFS